MEFHLLPGAHASKPVHTRPDQFGDWLTVAEAAAYCSLKDLERTPKTVRKWAHRSHLDPENAELTVRREDVDNGFRWTIERDSLDRKIAQELEFEARRAAEPLGTGPDASGGVHTGAALENSGNGSADPSEPVRTSASPSEPVRNPNAMIDELRERIDDLKGEVAFYRDELRDRRHTTAALTDVIEAFRLTAQSNASKAERESEWNANQPRFFDEGDNALHGGISRCGIILYMNRRSIGELRTIADVLTEKNIILKGADHFTEKGFTQVPNAVLRSKKITMGAKMAYVALISYAWHNDYCFPGQQRLADDMGVSRQTANEYIQELKRKGFVNVVRKGQGRPNVYELKVTRG